jgi:hypothetical protein
MQTVAKDTVKWFNEKKASGISKQIAARKCSFFKPPFRKLASRRSASANLSISTLSKDPKGL